MTPIEFNIEEFRKLFPEFAKKDGNGNYIYTDEFLQYCYSLAVDFIGKCACDIEEDKKKHILYLATAHIAYLLQNNPQMAGAVTSATEGSVSVSFSTGDDLDSFWGSTLWGRLFLKLTRRTIPFIMLLGGRSCSIKVDFYRGIP